MDDGEFDGIRLCSVVKEVGVDDVGLFEFVTQYFNYDTYKDQALTFYTALGSGQISKNPFEVFAPLRVRLNRVCIIRRLRRTRFFSALAHFCLSGLNELRVAIVLISRSTFNVRYIRG